MRLILYTQYYRARTPKRQAELDHCLRSNLQHPCLDEVVVLHEPDAPTLPGPARMPVQLIEEAERLTYARWMGLVLSEPDSIGILINSDIALGKGWDQIEAVLNTPGSVVALSRYNPSGDGQPARLNKFPHWTQDTWALRSDAPIRDSLLYASGFPIGFPGCDNRIAYVLWSHGLLVKNACYHLETLHHQADVAREYDKNGDRLYGGVSYVHPTLSLDETSELEHTIWTRGSEPCPGVLVNQQAVDRGVHQLLAKDQALAQVFKEHHKSTGLAWANPPLGSSRSDYATTWPLEALLQPPGVVLELGEGQRRLQGLQLRLPRACVDGWMLELEGRRQPEESWEPLALGASAELKGDGRRQFIEADVLQQSWLQLRLRLCRREGEDELPVVPGQLVELLALAEKPPAKAKEVGGEKLQVASASGSRPVRLQLAEKRLELVKALDGQEWTELHRYNSRFSLRAREGRIALVDRFWPSALSFRDPALGTWDRASLEDAFLWGFVNPVLEWKPQQFSTEKLHPGQLNFWQYPCRTEQDAFERHQRIGEPYCERDVAHVYVGMPWATWIDKKTFPDPFLEAYSSRLKATAAVLQEWGLGLQVHSVCQHIRWKEYPHRFEQAGITQLWISHKEKGWDTEGRLQLHAWPLYAVNVLDSDRREGLELVPVEKKTIFAAFKGAHMKHYPTDIRLRLKELAHLEGYEIEVTDLWHFNKVVYNYQIANKQSDKDSVEKEDISTYNRLLSKTLFSLCPAGSGPNTLRLWESLGAGSIPVVLSDKYEFPTIPTSGDQTLDWSTAVINIPEDSLSNLESTLSGIGIETAKEMQASCIDLHQALLNKICFSTPRKADSVGRAVEVDTTRHGGLNISSQNPERTIDRRILIIGSSISIQKEGYLSQLKELALSRYGINLKVLNASLGGCSTEASLAYLNANLFYNVKEFGAKLALIEKSPNERHQLFNTLSLSQQRAYEEKIYNDTLELVHWCLANQMQPVLLCSYFKPSQSASWDASQPIGYLRRCYERVSERARVPLIDLYSFIQDMHYSDELLLDDVHLNQGGSIVMAEKVAKSLFEGNDKIESRIWRSEKPFNNLTKELQVLFKGSTEVFSTRLLTASFDSIDHLGKRELVVNVHAETVITGIFYISDQASASIQIIPDEDESKSVIIHTLDHMSFLPRVTYKSITGATASNTFRFIQSDHPVDLDPTIQSYFNSKTFNPKEEWAQRKYLHPLLERREGKRLPSEKIIAIFGKPTK